MGFEFIRKLTKGLPEELTETVVSALLDSGIEVYAEAPSGDGDLHDENREEEQGREYVIADARSIFLNGEIFVPAADRERAAELLEQAGALAYLCDNPVESLEMTEAERLQADMLRRQRRNMVICLVVIVLAALYYLISSVV